MSQMIAAPTFDSGSILDVIVTNNPDSVIARDVLPCSAGRVPRFSVVR